MPRRAARGFEALPNAIARAGLARNHLHSNSRANCHLQLAQLGLSLVTKLLVLRLKHTIVLAHRLHHQFALRSADLPLHLKLILIRSIIFVVVAVRFSLFLLCCLRHNIAANHGRWHDGSMSRSSRRHPRLTILPDHNIHFRLSVTIRTRSSYFIFSFALED